MAASGASPESSVRKRRVDNQRTETRSVPDSTRNGADAGGDAEKGKEPRRLRPGSHWLTRVVLLRAVAFIYREFLCRWLCLKASSVGFNVFIVL